MPIVGQNELGNTPPVPAIATLPESEDTMEEASMQWFVEFMRLYSRGLTPSVSANDNMPSPRALAEFFGPRSYSGYTFDDHGMPEYKTYARELFLRVLQLPWPDYHPLPSTEPRNAQNRGGVLQSTSDLTLKSPSLASSEAAVLPSKTEYGKQKVDDMTVDEVFPDQGECSTRKIRTIDDSTATGLLLLRPYVNAAVEAERLRFIAARHDALKTVHLLQSSLTEERNRLKFFERKVAENTNSQMRASEEYSKARDVYAAANVDEVKCASKECKARMKNFTTLCETLVNSWYKNLEIANARLDIWEFKLKRQNERIAKLTSELTGAELTYGDKRIILENSLTNIQAVADILEEL
ncbi:hypothetical protein M758_12G176500 [Ceratodon purpureus]|nr:hypothetical protein M758_12G176500 [Ceratodon purpureus]